MNPECSCKKTQIEKKTAKKTCHTALAFQLVKRVKHSSHLRLRLVNVVLMVAITIMTHEKRMRKVHNLLLDPAESQRQRNALLILCDERAGRRHHCSCQTLAYQLSNIKYKGTLNLF